MKKNKIIKDYNMLILIFLFSLSLSILSCYLMIGKINRILKLLTAIISFTFGIIYFYKNYEKIKKQIVKNNKNNIFTFIISLIIFFELKNTENLVNKIFGIKILYYFTFPILFLIITLVYINIKKWIIKFIDNMDTFDKKAYKITSIITLIILFLIYSSTDYFYIQFDKFYSIDSGWVYGNIYPDSFYYDIRHPLMSIITFPIYSIVNFLFSSNLKPIILQYLNIQMLIIVGLELKQLTKNKYVYLFYILSFPTILFSIFFEKYVLCVFLMTTYLYNFYINKKDNALLPVLIGGLMPTNAVIAITEFLKNKNLKKRIVKIVLTTIVVIILSGRIQSLIYGFIEILEMKSNFSTTSYSIFEKINATLKMIEQSFIGLSSSFQNGKFWWDNVCDNVSLVGFIVTFIIILSIIDIIKQKNKAYLSFLIMFIFSFILFIVLEWSVHESPLFSICFSWSIISLFIFGLDNILLKLNVDKKYIKYIYNSLLIIMIFVNIYRIFSIDFSILIS